MLKQAALTGIALFFLSQLSVVSASDHSLYSCVEHYPPLKVIDGDSISGEWIEAVRVVGIVAGKTVTFDDIPFDQCMKRLKLGSIDIVSGLIRTPERERHIEFVPFTTDPAVKVFMTRMGGPVIDRYEDLQKLKIAKMKGVVQFQRFDSDSSLDTVDVPNHASGVQMLRSGRVDSLLLILSRAKDLATEHPDLMIQPYRENTNIQLHFGLSRAGLSEPKRQHLRKLISEADRQGRFLAAIRRFRESNPQYY